MMPTIWATVHHAHKAHGYKVIPAGYMANPPVVPTELDATIAEML